MASPPSECMLVLARRVSETTRLRTASTIHVNFQRAEADF